MHISKSEIALLRSLAQKKIREREKKFLVEGWKSVHDAVASDFHIELIAMTEEQLVDPDRQVLVHEIESRKIKLKILSKMELKQVSDTVHAQGVVAMIGQKTRTIDELFSRNPKLLVFADRVADPGNLGTMVRTCDWFGVDGLILSNGCVDLYNEKVVRSTSGSIFHIPVVERTEAKEIVPQLRAKGFWIVATSGESKISYSVAPTKDKNLLIFGNESVGIHPDMRRMSDLEVNIPRLGKAESLNVGVACGIILSNLKNQR